MIQRHGVLLGEIDAGDAALPPSAERADVVVVLGGDGTILGEARRCLHLGKPMLGINTGRLGFIAEFELHDLEAQAETLLGNGSIETRRLPLIQTTVESPDGTRAEVGLALNEAVIAAGPPFRVIELEMSIDGKPGPTFRGDGLILSTPTGSTAHSVSAGGPIAHPDVDALIITPIAPHSLAFRPIVVPGDARLELLILRANGDEAAAGTTLLLDGQVARRLGTADRVMLRRSERSARFVVNPRGHYWSTLTHKLRWAEAPRLRHP
ncbi:MAG: NAD(+)/NADH kinase [Phycisphaeraceae bacterium]|nr:MAG: NAD(+)/NADH kinase [Phycisphaeraceae bacterium]